MTMTCYKSLVLIRAAAPAARPFCRTGTLAQALEGNGDMFVDIDDLLDVENDLLDTDDDLLQELDLGTAQAATPAARPVSRTGTYSLSSR